MLDSQQSGRLLHPGDAPAVVAARHRVPPAQASGRTFHASSSTRRSVGSTFRSLHSFSTPAPGVAGIRLSCVGLHPAPAWVGTSWLVPAAQPATGGFSFCNGGGMQDGKEPGMADADAWAAVLGRERLTVQGSNAKGRGGKCNSGCLAAGEHGRGTWAPSCSIHAALCNEAPEVNGNHRWCLVGEHAM